MLISIASARRIIAPANTALNARVAQCAAVEQRPREVCARELRPREIPVQEVGAVELRAEEDPPADSARPSVT
jgi:hypothetical protein